MLPERITQLLSAYVDGELSSRERKNVTRILRKSNEARQMLHKLKQDSMILRRMPRRKTQIDLSGSVMGTISVRGITLPKIEWVPVKQTPPPPPKPRWRFWAIVAAGLLLLIAIGIGSYFAFISAFRHGVLPGPNGVNPTNPGNGLGPDPAINEPEKPLPVIGLVHEPETPEAAPRGIDPRKDDRCGHGRTRSPGFVTAQPRLMLIQSLRDLEKPAAGQAFFNELKKDGATRLDLFCQTDTIQGLDRLQAAFKAQGVALRLDAYAQVRVKKKEKTNYAIYCEDLTPQEWTLLMQHLAREEQKSAGFDRLTANPLDPVEMAKILGGEPAQYEQPARSGPLGVDVSQDVSSGTGSQLVQRLQTPPSAPEGPDKGLVRQAVAVPYLPQPGFSREVRYIVESRKGWRRGAIQVLLVLWNPN